MWPSHLFNQNQTNTGSWLYSEPQPASAVTYIKQGRVYNISNINHNLPVGLLVPAISLQVYYNIITFISIALTHWFVVVSSILLLFTYSQFCIGLLDTPTLHFCLQITLSLAKKFYDIIYTLFCKISASNIFLQPQFHHNACRNMTNWITLLLSLLKREIKRVSDPVVLDIPVIKHFS